MMIDRIYDSTCASACFFRSTVHPPKRKIMLQITQRCNLHCAHCFAESGNIGNEMSLSDIRQFILPQLIKNQVVKVTLTGGEPLCNPSIKQITQLLLDHEIGVSICTNATLIDPLWIEQLSQHKNIHFNVSLDGMRMESHGRFRGGLSEETFKQILQNILILGKHKLLNGILTTPNQYATIDEYVDLCNFAKEVGANYVLMNPLSPFGRGVETQALAYSNAEMCALKEKTKSIISSDFEVVYIRFPNIEHKPIGRCPLGSILYVFCNGDVAICPYMVFAANGNNSYNPRDFIMGNIFKTNMDFTTEIKKFHKNEIFNYNIKQETCLHCSRGCYAIKISQGQELSDCDFDMCPLP